MQYFKKFGVFNKNASSRKHLILLWPGRICPISTLFPAHIVHWSREQTPGKQTYSREDSSTWKALVGDEFAKD